MSSDDRNRAKGTGSNYGEGALHGRSALGQQEASGRYPATASNSGSRTRRTKELNKQKCYIKSDPSKRGFRKRMFSICNELGVFELNEQKLAGQALAIRTNGWLSEIEIEEIKREINCDEGSQDARRSVNEDSVEGASQGISDREGDIRVDTEESEQRRNQEDGRLQLNGIIDVMRKDKCTENQIELLIMLMQELDKDKVEQPPNMRNTDRRKLKKKTAEVDKIIKYVPINSLSEVNDLMKAVGNVVAKLLGFKSPKKKEKQEPWWKRRIEVKSKFSGKI